MHCHICDKDSDTVKYDKGQFTPCSECEEVIYETLRGYPDSTIGNPDDMVLGFVDDEVYDDDLPF